MIHQESHRKIALACMAILVTFIATMNMAWAASCKVNCLRIYSIDLRNLGTTIRGTVKLTDETGSGGGARSTVVHGVWTRPDGSTFDQYANIGTRLRAEFTLYTAGAPGRYKFTVAGASKAGYTFDTNNGALLSESILVGDPTNIPPIATANADATTVGTDTTVSFDSYGSEDPDGVLAGYYWDFGDGASSSDMYPTHAYTTAGTFDATLTVTDDKGATGSATLRINVTDAITGCVSNCMSVDRIDMSFKVKTGKVKGKVWLLDENDGPVAGATVRAVWTLPDGTTVDRYREVKTKSRVIFGLPADTPGLYTLTVSEIVKDGYTFDGDSSNVLDGTITIVP